MLRTLLMLLVAVPAVAHATPAGFTRFTGGRGAHECALVTDVGGATRTGAAVATCTDGDPACDADGRVDGTCTIAVRLCFDAVVGGCTPELVVHAALVAPAPALAAVAGAVAAMTMPVGLSETCTDVAPIPLATGTRRRARVVLRSEVAMASGHTDRDRVVLACRRPPSAGTATFATVQRLVFARSCATFSCHGAAAAGGLTLADDAAYANLVGVSPANDAARAEGLLRVAPGDPSRSFLLRKLAGPLTDAEGAAMPRVGTSLPAARIDLVRRWIAAGAPAVAPF